jgi:hypothetical protein
MFNRQLVQMKQIKNSVVVATKARVSVRRPLNEVRGYIWKKDSQLTRHDQQTPSGEGRLTSSVPDPDL